MTDTDKKSVRFVPFVKLASIREDEAARNLQKATENLSKEEAQLKQLIAYRDEYHVLLEDETEGVKLTAMRRHQFCEFLKTIESGIQMQQKTVVHAEGLLKKAKEDWGKAYARHSSLEKFTQKCEASEIASEEKSEQKRMDDRSQRKAPSV